MGGEAIITKNGMQADARAHAGAAGAAKVSRRGFLAVSGATLLLGACDPCSSIFPCNDTFDNGGCVVSQKSGMKAGESLKVGEHELVYAGFSGNGGSATFNVKDSGGNIVNTLDAPLNRPTAVEKEECGCTGYAVTVTGMDSAKGTIDAEVRKTC